MEMEKVEDYRGKYKELELRERGVTKFQPTQSREWDVKKSLYQDEGVKKAFMAIKASLRLICTDAGGYHYIDLCHNFAQVMIDRFLIQRCKGMECVLPGPVVNSATIQQQPASKAESKGNGILKITASKSDFTDWDGKIDTINDINWIYNHLMVADVKPADAPSPGAWAHLQYHRSSPAAMDDFFTKVYPRLIPAKGTIQKLADKLHDDGRTTFDLLDRLLAEDEGSAGQIPPLSVVLPEHPGL